MLWRGTIYCNANTKLSFRVVNLKCFCKVLWWNHTIDHVRSCWLSIIVTFWSSIIVTSPSSRYHNGNIPRHLSLGLLPGALRGRLGARWYGSQLLHPGGLETGCQAVSLACVLSGCMTDSWLKVFRRNYRTGMLHSDDNFTDHNEFSWWN